MSRSPLPEKFVSVGSADVAPSTKDIYFLPFEETCCVFAGVEHKVQDVVNDLKGRKKKATIGKTPAENPDGFDKWEVTINDARQLQISDGKDHFFHENTASGFVPCTDVNKKVAAPPLFNC